MNPDPELRELNKKVTAAIFRAEHLPEGSRDAVVAFREVSHLEEAIARRTNPEHLDGNVSRRGAITAALSAGDWLRALTLVDIFLSEPAPPNLAQALVALRDEAEQELLKFTPPDVRPVEFHLAAA